MRVSGPFDHSRGGIVALRRVARLHYGDALSEDVREPGPVPVFASGGQVGWHWEANAKGPLTVVGRKGSYGSVHWVDTDAFVIDTAYAVEARAVSARWLYYVLGVANLRALSRDVGVPGLSRESVHELFIPDLELDRQADVAAFLDRECERIEVLRASVSRLRAQREELVSAVIREEVGGCDIAGGRRLPDFDWLPGLPANWPVLQIRRVARTGTGHTPSRTHEEYWIADECTIPWFTLADVWQIRSDEVELVTETSEKISQAGVDNSSAELHPRGTVLLSRTASVGFSAVMGREMAVSQDFMTWTCGDLLDPYFLLYALRAMRPELYRLTAGSTHKTIYMPDLHALRIPLPEVDDQVRIVARIRDRVGSVTQLGELDDRLDARLTEYRDALITETVTGQLDVTRLSDAQLDESAHAALEGETPGVLAS